jgi:hypothetical protein
MQSRPPARAEAVELATPAEQAMRHQHWAEWRRKREMSSGLSVKSRRARTAGVVR